MSLYSVTFVIIIFHIVLYENMFVNSASTFIVYDEPDYAGDSTYCEDVNIGCNVSEVISIKKMQGTCAKIWDSKTGKSIFIKEDIKNTDYYYNGQIGPCPTKLNIVACPNGMFVKAIEWDTAFYLTKGIKMTCNKPESISSNEAVVIQSHQTQTFSESTTIKCPAFNELTTNRNLSLDAEVDLLIDVSCVAENKTEFDQTFKCENFTALSGMSFSIETETKYIKYLNLICSHIPHIGELCTAEDEEVLLPFPSKNFSQIIKTVGVGIKSSMSESEKNEFNFYEQFRTAVAYHLSVNFKTRIGKSKVTSYGWGSAPKSTWQKEQHITIEVETDSKCNTRFFEIVGKCSYMTVRPFYLKRLDDCSSASFSTVEKIPHGKRFYRSPVPYNVKMMRK